MKRYIVLLLLSLALSLSFADDLRLDIMWTNDMHGGIDRSKATFMNPEFPPQLGGGASAASLIKSVRSQSGKNRGNLLIDVGDFFQGRPVGTVTNGRSVIEYMNLVQYDALVLGNHEFDISRDKLEQTLEMANFPILTCNIIDTTTGKIPWFAFPYTIVNRMGLRIGILGYTTTDTKQMSFPENISNLDFLEADEVLPKYIKILREEEKVDILILVAHAGLPYDNLDMYLNRFDERGNRRYNDRRTHWGYDAQEIAQAFEGIDLILGGHIHVGRAEPWIDPRTHTMVIQGYAYGSNLGMITLTIDPETKSVSGYELPALREGAMITLFEDQFIPDPDASELIEAYVAEAEAGMDEVIGFAGVHLHRENTDAQSPMGNTIVDAMRYMVDADFAFLNLGGVRADIKYGPVTYRDVFEVMPFDNMLVTFECTGEFLKRIIEARVEGSRAGLIISGAEVVYSRARPSWDRVTSLKIGGEEWDPNKIYKVATTDFLLQGNAGLTMLLEVPQENIENNNIDLRDAIVHYFKEKSPINTKVDNRWKRDDNSELAPWMKK
nr:5-nucleotidase / UDP-sugar diphosphatase [Candidatus Cloacimonadota bacterium]